MGVLEQMVKERVAPDSRTYGILIRASIFNGLFEQAVGLLKGALGLPDTLNFLRQSSAVCRNLESAVVGEALVGLVDRGHAQDIAIPLLAKIRQDAPWVRVDAATQRKVMSGGPTSDAGGRHPWRSERSSRP